VEFKQIACADSKLRISENDACRYWRGTQSGLSPYVGAHVLVMGTAAGLDYKVTTSYSDDPMTWMLVVHSDDLPRYLASYDGTTDGASSWSEMIKSGPNDFFRPFTAGPRKCFAFHHRGPVFRSGTKSRTTGWFCDSAKPEGYTVEQMKAVFAAVRIED
jgi:hypothetical protein